MTRQEALSEATFCRRSAQSVNDPEYRSALLELADWWSQQAEWPQSATDLESSHQIRAASRT